MVFIGKSKDKNKDIFCLNDNFVQRNVEYVQLNLYIKDTQGKGALNEQLPLIYRLKLYALFINWKNETDSL